jgi:hypothetical protein
MNGATTPRIDGGTAVRNNTPAPGGVGGASSHNSGGYHYEMHEVGWLDMSDAAHAIWDALRASRALVGPIVMEQTGILLEHIIAGLLPGLMMAIGVMAGTTVLGAAVGAIIGALAGGIGAAPGALIGGQLGYDLGTAAMALLGLGFLAHGIVEGLPQLKLHAEWATKRAVNSLYVPAAQKRSEINLAARDFAMAQALLLKLVLMSLVALLLKKPTAASVRGLVSTGRSAASAVRSGESVAAAEAGVAEIVAQLRASRLGEGFATWVESHWRELIENPKLRPQVKRTAGPVRTPEAVTPSQLAKQRSANSPAPAPQAPAKTQASKPPEPVKPPTKSFDEVYGKAPAAKAEIDALADDIAARHGGRVAKAPVKSVERAQQKIANDYGGDPTKIKDLARNTIIVPAENIEAVTAELAAKGAKVKVITAEGNPLGYSGVNTTIQTRAGIVGEVQVNSPEMIFAKEPEPLARALLGDDAYTAIAEKSQVPGGLGHKYYEEWRVLDASSAEADAIAQESRAYHEAIRSANAH